MIKKKNRGQFIKQQLSVISLFTFFNSAFLMPSTDGSITTLKTLVIDLISQLSRDVIGRLSVKPRYYIMNIIVVIMVGLL